MLPQREAETVWVAGTPFNRVDMEKGVFQRENMDYLTGEYEAFLYGDADETTLQVRMECLDTSNCENVIVNILFEFTKPGGLEFYRIRGRPKRLVDRR
jgi:phenylacetate-coenzyme A ligase PaaK-like adenylate-forming protein